MHSGGKNNYLGQFDGAIAACILRPEIVNLAALKATLNLSLQVATSGSITGRQQVFLSEKYQNCIDKNCIKN